MDHQGEPEQVVYIIFKNYISITDDMDDNVKLTITPPDPYPVGTTIVHFTATDDGGNSTSGSITIIVEENPDLHYIPGYYGSSSDFGISTIFYGPWSPPVSSYPEYYLTQGYASYEGYTYGLPGLSVLSSPEYMFTPVFASYGGYYSGGNEKTFSPLFTYMAPWGYPSPSFVDYLPYRMNTENFNSTNRLSAYSLSPFYDILSYQYLRQPFPANGFLENIPAIFLFSR